MSPMRLDRVELRGRLEGRGPRWIYDELMDAYELAAIAARQAAEDRAPAPATARPPREKLGRAPPTEES